MLSVVLAGGKGTRLWPESNEIRPKQMCDFFGQGSLLSMSLDRLAPLGRMLVVCGRDQLDYITKDISTYNVRVLGEPVGRNTAPAVGLVLAEGQYLDDEVIGIFPADHYIEDVREFCRVVREAEKLAADGYLVTVGIKPEGPETGYGYIEKDSISSFKVKAFHEKPDRKTAQEYINSGNFYWNAGIFIATAGLWEKLMAEHLPELYIHINQGYEAYLSAYYNLPGISIDYGIAEKCRQMAVVAGDFGWSDVGSWDALAKLLKQDNSGNALCGNAVAVESKNCLIRSHEKQLVLFGVEDLVVVETEDTVMVCPKGKSQDVKQLAELLETGEAAAGSEA